MNNQAMWSPSVLEIMQAQIAVLSDSLPGHAYAIFVHGSPIRDDKLDNMLLTSVANKYHHGTVRRIILNGLNHEHCRQNTLPYNGYEPWVRFLNSQGIKDDDIYFIPPANHTAAESKQILSIAKQNNFDTILIASQAYHQLRCFLSIVAQMTEMKFFPAVYNAPAPGIPWNYQCERLVLQGQNVLGQKGSVATVADHTEGELERIIKYAQSPGLTTEGKPQFTRHATIPEMFTYLAKRS